MAEKKTSNTIGIDLGTSNSCLASFHNGKVEIITNDQGMRTTPSYVAFTEKVKLIGDSAKSQAIVNYSNTIFNFKRVIGRKFADSRFQSEIEFLPCRVVDMEGLPRFHVEHQGEGRAFTPEEITSMFLVKMKEMAESYLGSKVTDAVITVPTHFTQTQRNATKDAGALAGLNVLRLINETSAAGLAFSIMYKDVPSKCNILLLDLGGGFFDVSIHTIDDGISEVKSTAFCHLGGEDFTVRMIQHCVNEFYIKYNKDIRGNKRAMIRLRKACEEAKMTLSSWNLANIEIDSLDETTDLSISISRDQFEEFCSDLFDNILNPVENVLNNAEMSKSDINEIVLVGGSSRMPKVQTLIQNFFNGKKLNTSLHPDETVAYGAAVQAAILSGDTSKAISDLLLLDVTTHSIGIESVGGKMTTLIKKDTPIPVRQSATFNTSTDNQTAFAIQIYEGEGDTVVENNNVYNLIFKGITPAPLAVSQIEVTLDIDSNGRIKMDVVDKSTGKKINVDISDTKNSQDLSLVDTKSMQCWESKTETSEEARNEIISLNTQVMKKKKCVIM